MSSQSPQRPQHRKDRSRRQDVAAEKTVSAWSKIAVMSASGLLAGKRVALLVEEEFEDRELTGPLDALRAAGATVMLVGPTAGAAFKGKRGEAVVTSDLAAGAARIADFDALVIPGGYAPDRMRMRHAMVDLARDAMAAGKTVAAICHGPQLLISANALAGRTLTCWPSIAIDVKNAGGLYVDKPVVDDGNLITSRKPDDVPAFTEAIIRALSNVHA
jgi:protease I